MWWELKKGGKFVPLFLNLSYNQTEELLLFLVGTGANVTTLGDECLDDRSTINSCSNLVSHPLHTPKQCHHPGPAYGSPRLPLHNVEGQAACSQPPSHENFFGYIAGWVIAFACVNWIHPQPHSH